MLLALLPQPFIGGTVHEPGAPLALFLVILPFTVIGDKTVGSFVDAPSVFFAFQKVSLVFFSCGKEIGPLTVLLIIDPVSGVDDSIRQPGGSLARTFPIQPVPLVY